jgi:hypothetical protein
MKTALTILFITATTATADLPAGFIDALHRVETGGRLGAVIGDGGAARGPLQIHRGYWKDAVEYDRSLGGRYQDVADLRYAAKVVDAYMRRYAPDAYREGDCEKMARIHNGGPAGHRKQATVLYWRKVNRWMGGDDRRIFE